MACVSATYLLGRYCRRYYLVGVVNRIETTAGGKCTVMLDSLDEYGTRDVEFCKVRSSTHCVSTIPRFQIHAGIGSMAHGRCQKS